MTDIFASFIARHWHHPRRTETSWFRALDTAGWQVPRWPIAAGGTGWPEAQQARWLQLCHEAGCPPGDIYAEDIAGPLLCCAGDNVMVAQLLAATRQRQLHWGLAKPGPEGYIIASQHSWPDHLILLEEDAARCHLRCVKPGPLRPLASGLVHTDSVSDLCPLDGISQDELDIILARAALPLAIELPVAVRQLVVDATPAADTGGADTDGADTEGADTESLSARLLHQAHLVTASATLAAQPETVALATRKLAQETLHYMARQRGYYAIAGSLFDGVNAPLKVRLATTLFTLADDYDLHEQLIPLLEPTP